MPDKAPNFVDTILALRTFLDSEYKNKPELHRLLDKVTRRLIDLHFAEVNVALEVYKREFQGRLVDLANELEGEAGEAELAQ